MELTEKPFLSLQPGEPFVFAGDQFAKHDEQSAHDRRGNSHSFAPDALVYPLNSIVWSLFRCARGNRWATFDKKADGSLCDFSGCQTHGHTSRLVRKTKDFQEAHNWYRNISEQPDLAAAEQALDQFAQATINLLGSWCSLNERQRKRLGREYPSRFDGDFQSIVEQILTWRDDVLDGLDQAPEPDLFLVHTPID